MSRPCREESPATPLRKPENLEKVLYRIPFFMVMGQDSSVDKATRYGLDGSGNESPW